jgi:hypothetical protein
MFNKISIKSRTYYINKKKIYEKIYNSTINDASHDFKQFEIDYNRSAGVLKLNKNFPFNELKFNNFIEKLIENNILYDVSNFIPQQIFLVCHDIIRREYPGYVMTNVEHFTCISFKSIKRKFDGRLQKMNRYGLFKTHSKKKYFDFTIQYYFHSHLIKITLKVFNLC